MNADSKEPIDTFRRAARRNPATTVLFVLGCCVLPLVGAAEDAKPASYFHDVVPILKRSCTGCHHPAKLKGDLDLTTYAVLQKGGKHGPAFKPNDPTTSKIIEEISGDEPSMPKEGDPLTKDEVALIERWIREGAKDDTPPDAYSFKLAAPPTYNAPPVISALACSADGTMLAVSGYHEVLLHHADGSGLIARLVGESPRIESVVFSPNNKLLAVSGDAPALFGEIQIWDVTNHNEIKSFKISNDAAYGIAFSPEGDRVAVGCADKTIRLVAIADGKELLHFDNDSDWVFATLFTVDGKRLLSGSRDRAMKLINLANGQFIDDINKLLEGVLCMARHPKEDLVAYGGDLGTPRIYKIAENQGRTAANNDVNLVREFERQPGPIHAIAYSPDGSMIAVGGVGGEVRVYKTSDGSRVATLKGHDGAVFAVTFNPKTGQVCTGGYDGRVRVFNLPSGDLAKAFIPVPIVTNNTKVAAAK
ncbi:MAG: c-type cytochrome domain-containing protein [Limisphaerales bacterium]